MTARRARISSRGRKAAALLAAPALVSLLCAAFTAIPAGAAGAAAAGAAAARTTTTATILVGSQNTVKTGYQSGARYDHYSVARTIEQALGLAPMTSNDKYASPINDAFH